MLCAEFACLAGADVSDTEQVTSQVASTLDYCRNFPRAPIKTIPRDHLLEEIRRTLEGRADIVLLVGDPLTGKSELLAELYRREPDWSIGIFLGPENYFKSKDYIRLVIAEQISWLVDRKVLRDDSVSEDAYSRMLYKLQKHTKRRKLTWLVDGLAIGKTGDANGLDDVLSLLPIGMREFSFVMSSETDIGLYISTSHRRIKTMEVMLVSPDEARVFLGDLIDDEKDIQEVRSFCLSSIGRMQKIRSMLSEDISIRDLLDMRNDSLEALFDFEWPLIADSPEVQYLIATIVFSERPISIAELSAQCGMNEESTLRLVRQSRVLSCRQLDQSVIVSIDSRAQRAYVARKLAHREQDIRNKAIARLLQTPHATEATRYLPAQLAKAGRHAEVLERLNPEHFVRLLETERTLRSLRLHAEFGRDSASQLGELGSEVAFSLISSVVTGLMFSVGTVEQIEAFTKLDLPELAFEIAAIAPTVEERLHLLARAANSFEARGQAVSDDIRTQLRDLVAEVDAEAIGNIGVDIACDLLAVDDKLALGLMHQVIDGAKRSADSDSESFKTDQIAQRDEGTPTLDEDARRKRKGTNIPEHMLQRFWMEAGRRVARQKVENLLARLRDEEPSFAVFLSKLWLNRNSKHKDAFKVADAALDFLLSDTSRSPQIQDLREIAQVLPHIDESTECSRLCGRLETQYRVLGHHGTSVESVRLRMQLYGAKYTGEQTDIELDLIEMFVEIQGLPDVSTRAACWAWMLHHLCAFPYKEGLETHTELAALASNKLEETISELLMSAADHFKVARGAIEAIVQSDPGKAFGLVKRLNTVDARDKGYEALVRALLPQHVHAAGWVLQAIGAIKADRLRNDIAVEVLMTLRRRHLATDGQYIDDGILSLWRGIEILSFKFQAAVITLAYQLEAGRADIADSLSSDILAIWDSAPVGSVKIQLGYLAASELAEVDRKIATAWIKRTEQFAQTSNVSSDSVNSAIYLTVRLCARLLPAVFPSGTRLVESAALNRLTVVISAIPSPELQVRLWCDIAIRLYFEGHVAAAKEIVDRRVSPLLDRDYINNSYLKFGLITVAGPALYLAHQSTAIHRIDSMTSGPMRDETRRNIVQVLLRRTPAWEPYLSLRETEYDLDPNTVADVLNLLRACCTDSTIFPIVGDLCRSLAADRNKGRIQRNAVLDYLRTLEEIVEKLLPDRENIQHNGYLIACKAAILRARSEVQRDSVSQVTLQWEALYAEARSITNVSDRAVVAALVGVSARVKQGSIVSAWLNEVKSDLAAIPSLHDRLDRYEWIARIVEPADKVAARVLLSEGLTLSNYLPQSEDVVQQQRRILDFAHAIDPNLATDLVEKFDTDEARKAPLKKRLEANAKRKRLASKPDSLELGGLDNDQLAKMCLENLGSLVAGRISTRPIEEFKGLHRRAGAMPIQNSLPIWDWFFENAIRKRGPLRVVGDGALPKFFEATCKAAEIAHGLIGRLASRPAVADLPLGTVKAGERDIFLARLTEWASAQDGGTIWISDPYFAPPDLEILRLMSQAAPKASFKVATSREQMKRKQITQPEESFIDFWQEKYDIEPPPTEFVIVGFGNEGKHPIHDRWIVSSRSGIRLGSSINSIGVARISEISVMSEADAIDKSTEINIYFDAPPKLFSGERLIASYFRWRR
jgi:hypothetical protein